MRHFELKREYPRTIAFRVVSATRFDPPFVTPADLLAAMVYENKNEATLIGFALVVYRLERDRALLDSLAPDEDGWYRVNPFVGHSDSDMDFLRDEAQIAVPKGPSEEIEQWTKKQNWH